MNIVSGNTMEITGSIAATRTSDYEIKLERDGTVISDRGTPPSGETYEPKLGTSSDGTGGNPLPTTFTYVGMTRGTDDKPFRCKVGDVLSASLTPTIFGERESSFQ